MKKTITIVLPLVIAAGVVIAVPYVRSQGGCSCHAPLIVFGGMLGCGGSTPPAGPSPSMEISNTASLSAGAPSAPGTQTEHKVTFVEIGSVKCIPCRMMQPIMEEIEKEYAGQVKIIFHDVWTPQGKADAMKYGIQVIPTQVFLDSQGKEYYRHQGFFPKDELVKILKLKGVQ